MSVSSGNLKKESEIVRYNMKCCNIFTCIIRIPFLFCLPSWMSWGLQKMKGSHEASNWISQAKNTRLKSGLISGKVVKFLETFQGAPNHHPLLLRVIPMSLQTFAIFATFSAKGMHPIPPTSFLKSYLGHCNKVRYLYWTVEKIPKTILLYYAVSQNLCRKLECLCRNLCGGLLYHFYPLLPSRLQRTAAENSI